MANVLDYLKWRGDLSIAEFDINELDSLVFSRLVFHDYQDVVPQALCEPVALHTAAGSVLAKSREVNTLLREEDFQLLEEAARSPRFSGISLCGYEQTLDKRNEEQFAAICFHLGGAKAFERKGILGKAIRKFFSSGEDELVFVAFRGTDDSLIGWKENLNMVFMSPVPAQEKAVAYLNAVAKAFPTAKIIVGGHSKGGNLAIYSSAFASENLQDRIINVYNNDGPGLNEKLAANSGYTRIIGKIKTFVPEASIVGMLLERREPFYIVKSDGSGFGQHNLYMWHVERDKLIYTNERTKNSKLLENTARRWIADMDINQREEFVEAFYDLICTTGGQSFSELTNNSFINIFKMIIGLGGLSDRTKEVLMSSLKLLIKSRQVELKKQKS